MRCTEDVGRKAACIAFIFVVVVGCGSPSQSSQATTSPGATTGGFLGSLGNPGCAPAATFRRDGMQEIGTTSSRGSLWALFFNPVPPSVGEDIKVVWRMTGSGVFTFRISDAAGRTVPALWGPESHSGSTWVHPGDEVGTGFNFPHVGCWDIHIDRSDASGDLWLEVVSPRPTPPIG
jgi:hypothetical protein